MPVDTIKTVLSNNSMSDESIRTGPLVENAAPLAFCRILELRGESLREMKERKERHDGKGHSRDVLRSRGATVSTTKLFRRRRDQDAIVTLAADGTSANVGKIAHGAHLSAPTTPTE